MMRAATNSDLNCFAEALTISEMPTGTLFLSTVESSVATLTTQIAVLQLQHTCISSAITTSKLYYLVVTLRVR